MKNNKYYTLGTVPEIQSKNTLSCLLPKYLNNQMSMLVLFSVMLDLNG
jgi:hypothetical protein